MYSQVVQQSPSPNSRTFSWPCSHPTSNWYLPLVRNLNHVLLCRTAKAFHSGNLLKTEPWTLKRSLVHNCLRKKHNLREAWWETRPMCACVCVLGTPSYFSGHGHSGCSGVLSFSTGEVLPSSWSPHLELPNPAPRPFLVTQPSAPHIVHSQVHSKWGHCPWCWLHPTVSALGWGGGSFYLYIWLQSQLWPPTFLPPKSRITLCRPQT